MSKPSTLNLKGKSNCIQKAMFFLLSLVAISNTTKAQFTTINEPFKNSSYDNTKLTIFGDATLTAPGIDPSGSGWLRLTPDLGSKVGYVVMNQSFPSKLGVEFEFEFKVYGSSGADGFSVFLFDAATPTFSIGAPGGALGYSRRDAESGVSGGYLGVGIDEYGNFGASTESKPGGYNSTGVADAISVRGPGNGTTGYNYITGTGPQLGGTPLAGTSIDYTTVTTTRPADATYYRKAKVLIEPDATYTNYFVSVLLQTSPTGSYTTIINHVSIGTVPPANLKLGFAASTGGSTSIHEVRNVIVRTPANPDIAKTALTQLYNGETITYTITANNSSLVALNSGAIRDTVPSGITISNIVVNTTGGASATLTSGATNPQMNVNITSFPAGSSVTATITGTVNVPDLVTTVKNTAYLKNLPASYTDPDPLNNVSSIITNIKHIDLEVTSVDYPATPATLIACNDYVASIGLRNNGDDLPVPPGYRVSVVLPPGTTHSTTGSTPGGVYNAGTNTVTWDLSTSALNTNATANVYVGFTVLSTATSPLAGITASISSLGVQIDKLPANNSRTSATKAVNVVPLVAGQVSADQAFCANGDPIAFSQTVAASGGTGSYNYQWQSSTNGGTTWTDIGSATLPTYDAPNITATTQYRRRVTSGTNGCWTAYSNTVTVTITPAVNAGSIGTAQTICSGSAPATLTEVTAPTGGNGTFAYQWQSSPNNSAWTDISGANGSTYTPPTLTANTYYRRRVSSGSCGFSNSTSVLITVVTPLTANAGADICRNNNNNFNMAATAPTSGTGTWSIISQTGSISITNPNSATTQITGITNPMSAVLRWTVTNSCGSSYDDVVISRNDNPSIPNISPITASCAGITRTFTTPNEAGVYFTWSITAGTGVTIVSGQGTNTVSVDIASNASSTFTIRVIANTGCGTPTNNSRIITVNPLPTVNAGADQNKCSGSFTMAANNAGLGYTQSWSVSYQDPTVTAVNFSNTSSNNATVSLTGVGKATLVWTVTNNTTGCSNSDDVEVTLGASTPTGIAGNRCGTGTIALSASGAIAGELYRWYDAANTLLQTNASPNFATPSISGTTTYYVAIYNATGNCESVKIPVVATVNPLPTVFTVGGGGVSCSGAGVNVVLSGSETGINYQLQIGGTNTGSPLAGTGSALTFNNLTTAGTYTIVATNASTSCSQAMTGSSVITTGTAPGNPSGISASKSPVCQGDNNITYSVTAVAGVTYTWSFSGTGATISGTGNSVSINYSASATSGVLSVTATNACGTSAASTVNVTVNSLPTQPGAFSASSPTVCQGQNNVTYTIPAVSGATSYSWTYSGTGATISGSGTTVNLSFSSTATSGTLSVTASNSCGTSPAQTIAINVTPLPAQPAAFTTSSVNVCRGQSNVAFIVPDDPTVNYIWNYGGTGATITNTRGSALISFDNTATSGTLSVTATNGCGLSTSRTINITVNPLPTVFNITGGGTICSGATGAPISLSGSQTGVSYQLKDASNSNVGTAVAGTGAALNFGNIATAGTYTVLATNTTTTCNQVMNGSATVTVDPVSVGGTVATSTTVCSGTNSGTLTLSGHTGNVVRWESSINGGTSWTTITNTTTSQTYTNLTATTLYRAVVKSGVCAEANSGTATITIDPVSVGGTVSASAAVCSGVNNGTLTLSGHTGNVVRWEFSTNGGTSWTNITNTTTTLNYTNLTTSTVYRAVVQNGSCTIANSGTATITVNLSPTVAATPLAQETLCNGNAITAISISNPSSIPGTTFSWTRNKTVEVSGIAASGNGSSITGSLTNTTNSVQVVDFTITPSANGCPGNPVTVSVTVYPTMILTMVAKDVSCTGGNDGEIMLTVSGGKPPYQFTINDGANYYPAVPTNTSIYTFSNLLKGTYNVIVRDANGCTAFPCQLP